ncbi:MAG: iron-sulfur cluster assembly protein [Pseudomonadota bacterium]
MPDPAAIARESALSLLDEVKDPCSAAAGTPLGLLEMGLVKRLVLKPEGTAIVELRLTAPFCHMIAYFHEEITKRLTSLPGICTVEISTDEGLDWNTSYMSPAAQAARARKFAAAAALAGQ